MSDLILKVRNLNVSFGDKQIIRNLSFDVQEKETLIVMGPNGAGKTTLFRALLGLIPYEGEVVWREGIKIGYLPSQEVVARMNNLPLTLADFFSLKNISGPAMKEIIKQVGLDLDVLKKNLNKLSTGQFQRALIAWTLSDNPDVLLFDEPTSGIDIAGQKVIYDLLHKFWRERGLTIMMITHELNIVWEHANHVLCLGSGHICYGPPRKVLIPDELERIYGVGIKFYEHKRD